MGGSGSLIELPMGVALPPMGRLSRGPEGPPSVLPQAPAENRTPRCADSGWLDSAARGLRRGATLPPLQHCIDPPLSSLYPPVPVPHVEIGVCPGAKNDIIYIYI